MIAKHFQAFEKTMPQVYNVLVSFVKNKVTRNSLEVYYYKWSVHLNHSSSKQFSFSFLVNFRCRRQQ
jgi:hypothetical protein